MNIPSIENLDKRIQLEMYFIFSDPLHRFFTWRKVGHEPTSEELLTHWEESGAARRFAKAADCCPFIWPPDQT